MAEKLVLPSGMAFKCELCVSQKDGVVLLGCFVLIDL